MTAVASQLKAYHNEILQSMGLDLLRRAQADPPGRLGVAMPRYQCNVDLDEDLLVSSESSMNHILDVLEGAKRELFGKTLEHIAKHDRSPVDRLAQIEDLALSLIKAIKLVGFVPMSVAGPAAELEILLRNKPGSLSWSRRGHGAEP